MTESTTQDLIAYDITAGDPAHHITAASRPGKTVKGLRSGPMARPSKTP